MDNVLYISGQLGMKPSGDLVEGFEAQTRLALDNIGHILKAAGATFKNGKFQHLNILMKINLNKRLFCSDKNDCTPSGY